MASADLRIQVYAKLDVQISSRMWQLLNAYGELPDDYAPDYSVSPAVDDFWERPSEPPPGLAAGDYVTLEKSRVHNLTYRGLEAIHNTTKKVYHYDVEAEKWLDGPDPEDT